MIGGFADFQVWVSIFNLVSSNQPPPPGFIPPGNIFTPVAANLSGIASVTDLAGFYQGNTDESSGIISVTAGFTVVDDGSGNLMQLTLTNPLLANFTNANQAKGSGDIIKTANLNIAGAVGDGKVHSVVASTSGSAGVLALLEGATPDTSYYVVLNWKYQIQ